MPKCPSCKTTDLDIKNGQYYCPWDNKFFGDAQEVKKTQSIVNPITAKLAVFDSATFPKIGVPTINYRVSTISGSYFLKIALIIFLIVGYFSFGLYGNYIALSPFCNIEITSHTFGSQKEELFKSLDYLKNYEPDNFKNVCSYINEIDEQDCMVRDHRKDARVGTAEYKKYCYVRGTKIAYIHPKLTPDDISQLKFGDDPIKQKAGLINHLANFSKEYWTRGN